MKRCTGLLTLVLALGFIGATGLVGCEKNDGGAYEDAGKAADKAVEKATTQAEDAAEKVGDAVGDALDQ